MSASPHAISWSEIPVAEFARATVFGEGVPGRPIEPSAMSGSSGMLPIAIHTGTSDPSFRCPMAVAVIGGLITSTSLSLRVIPPVFKLVDDIEHGLERNW